MSNRKSSFYIVDIFIATNKISRYTNKFDNADDFLNSEMQWDATIRELEIIGEATNNLLKLKILDEEKNRVIVDFRNYIIHGYFGIDANIVWAVIKEKLPEFIADLKQIILNDCIDIKEAVRFAKNENINNPKTLELLDSFNLGL